MPVLSGVYNAINVVVDGKVRGMTLAPRHYALGPLTSLALPVRIESITIVGPEGPWFEPTDAIEKGSAVLGEPFDAVKAIGMVGDVQVYGPGGLTFWREALNGRQDDRGN